MAMTIDTKGFTPVELTDEQLAEMREEVHDRVIVARVGLLLRHPFFGNMATRMAVKSCDDWCPTAATDGKNLYYNTQFFNMLTNKQIEFVIAHEILHCVFDHIVRREDRDGQIYNIACDYLVNNCLVRDKIGEVVTQIKIFQDFKYDNWSSEQVYDDIFEKYDDEELKQLGELLDEHIDWEKSDDNGKDKKGNAPGATGDKKGKGRPTYTKKELKKIRDEIKESMISSAQAAGAGNLPGEVARMIKDLTEPKMNWRDLIRQQIQTTIRNDFTFQRTSRKGWHTNAIIPGMNFMETIDICVAIDMSGSIGDIQGRDFLSEIQGIMEEYPEYNIKVWCFDTKVYNEQDFSPSTGEDLRDYEIMGGGGTDFMANWTYMKEQDIQPKKFIMFTDGYAWDSWGDPDYCDTLFVIHSNRDKSLESPFGVSVHYDEAA
jgi:predicted metal-dependent peptidase|tara:strand:+ start:2608 stop:3900 length:1293 start_codon:yes stop_codon:yes gene_type:complete